MSNSTPIGSTYSRTDISTLENILSAEEIQQARQDHRGHAKIANAMTGVRNQEFEREAVGTLTRILGVDLERAEEVFAGAMDLAIHSNVVSREEAEQAAWELLERLPELEAQVEVLLQSVKAECERLAQQNSFTMKIRKLEAVEERLEAGEPFETAQALLAEAGVNLVDHETFEYEGRANPISKLLDWGGPLKSQIKALEEDQRTRNQELGLSDLEYALRVAEGDGLQNAAREFQKLAAGEHRGYIGDTPFRWALPSTGSLSATALDSANKKTLILSATMSEVARATNGVIAALELANVGVPEELRQPAVAADALEAHLHELVEGARGVFRNEMALSNLVSSHPLFGSHPELKGKLLADVLEEAGTRSEIMGPGMKADDVELFVQGLRNGGGILPKVFARIKYAHSDHRDELEETPAILPDLLRSLEAVTGIKGKPPEISSAVLEPKDQARVAFHSWHAAKGPEFEAGFEQLYSLASGKGIQIVDFERSGLMGSGGTDHLTVEKYGVKRRIPVSSDEEWSQALVCLAASLDGLWLPSAPIAEQFSQEVEQKLRHGLSFKTGFDPGAMIPAVAALEQELGIRLDRIEVDESSRSPEPNFVFVKNGFERKIEIERFPRNDMAWIAGEDLVSELAEAWFPDGEAETQATTAEDVFSILSQGRDPVARLVKEGDASQFQVLAIFLSENNANLLGVFPQGDGYVVEVEHKERVAQVPVPERGGTANQLVDAIVARLRGRRPQ